ncbi:Predicted metal-dependent phosphoesterase TrpH, contains PHP domain [Halovenus aranensis]|jgi:predicted metal-dependent phosphoesterase TrpH|uniref:Predicted metal-dependent phosphoesterase TrpH, contains PHP domain n=1 Tax=Halovenus aranensis TaxID=890420 RepID=A0A1G8XR77_9EURY|nr:PHP-associated domain-containing protein [Halovenus aranensis]SDJ92684.1 Predicted metal-dependent phosphoesterase TrpH, contains PHP domain [Halovenus aranensis]
MTAAVSTRVDLHVKILDDEVVRRAKQAGLDVLVYAPHFTHLSDIRDRARRYSDEDLLVVPARECFADRWNRRRHVLVIDPDDPIPDFLTFEATMAEIDRRGETVLAPHPEFLTMSLAAEDVREYQEVFDAVEVFCPKNWWFHTRRMQSIAGELDLPTYVSSYSHLPTTIGEAWVEFERDITTAGDLAGALADGADPQCYRNDGLAHLLKRRAEFAHLSKENSWDKFARVVLEGDEPTNPSRYDDRFADDVAY